MLALLIAVVSFIAMVIYNLKLGLIYFAILALAYFLFKILNTRNSLIYDKAGNTELR
jgi:ethanolamine permease